MRRHFAGSCGSDRSGLLRDMLVRNLVENAAQYTSPGGAIRLELIPTLAGPELLIFNECSACGELKAEPRFEPFCRPDASRSAHSGGNGLGLTICQAVAAANGWKLTWNHEAGGVRAVVTFRTDPGGAV